MQVYRALEKLVEFGLVHRLETCMPLSPVVSPDAKGLRASPARFAKHADRSPRLPMTASRGG
jgi:hypothetical protein